MDILLFFITKRASGTKACFHFRASAGDIKFVSEFDTVYLLFYLLGLACVCLLLLKQQDFLPDGKLIPSIGFAYNAIQLSKDFARTFVRMF